MQHPFLVSDFIENAIFFLFILTQNFCLTQCTIMNKIQLTCKHKLGINWNIEKKNFICSESKGYWCATREGGTHMLRRTGMCRNFGSVFWKKSFNMGPIFHKKSPTMGLIFKIFQGSLCESQKILCFCGFFPYHFQGKSLNIDT